MRGIKAPARVQEHHNVANLKGPHTMASIVHLPARPAVPVSVATRRRRKAIAGKVLAFTGTKRFVYDREKVLRWHKEAMAESVMNLLVDIQCGKVIGVKMITSRSYDPDDDDQIKAAGVFVDDTQYGEGALTNATECFPELVGLSSEEPL